MNGPHGVDLFGENVVQSQGSKLGDAFLIPPFSVLNAREGWWQERKRAWLALGIKSELGRGGGANDMSPQMRALKPSAQMGGRTWNIKTDEYQKHK